MNTIFAALCGRGSYKTASRGLWGAAALRNIFQYAIVPVAAVAIPMLVVPSSVKAASANGYYQYVSGGGELTVNGEITYLSGEDLAGLVNMNEARIRIKGNKLPLKKSDAFKLIKQVNGKLSYKGPNALVLKKKGKAFKGSAAFKITAKVPDVQGIRVDGVIRVKMAMRVKRTKMTIKIPRFSGDIKITEVASGKTQTIKLRNGKGTVNGVRVSR